MKECYQKSRKEAAALYKKSMGVMIVLMVLFYLLKNDVLYPVIGKIWSLALSTVPGEYITEASIGTFFKYPYLLLIGAAIVVVYCIIVVWELSAIMMCFAYYDQDRPVSLWRLFPLSLQNIRHLAKRGNWLFFVYILLILPFTDLYSASGMVSSIAIPEYIADYIESSLALSLLVLVAYILLVWLTIRWLYAMQGVLISGKDFKQARADSVAMMRGRMIRQSLELLLYSFVEFLKVALLPLLICSVVIGITVAFTDEMTGEFLAFKIAYGKVFSDLFNLAADAFLRMVVMSYLVVNYRVMATEQGIYEVPDLPASGDKQGRVHLFRHLGTAIYAGITAVSVIVFAMVLYLADVSPETLGVFKATTLIAAHKGLSSEAPENTMDAFAQAYASEDVDLIELDVRESKDGIPIVIHNADLLSACGIDEDVYDLTYDEIRSYVASYAYEDDEYPDAYVPTLEEVLDLYGGSDVTLLIEIKADDRAPDLPAQIVDLIHAYDCADNCMIHSGSYTSLEAVKAADSTIPCGYIVAMGTGRYYDLPCADFFSVEHNFVNQQMIDEIHRLGKQVYVWTVNDESSIEDMLLLDVDVVITDYPDYVHDDFYTNNDLIDSVIQSQTDRLDKDERAEAKETYEEGDY